MESKSMFSKLSKKLIHNIDNLDSQAAVVVLMRIKDHQTQVLFVNRAEKTSDPWSGQTGLPGGKRNAGDQNIMKTVIRETLEETSINLLKGCQFLGVIDPVRSTKKPEMRILPFFFIQRIEQNIKLNEELTGFFWGSLEELVKHKGTVKYNLIEYPCFMIQNRVIWGLTYRIIDKLLLLSAIT
jgi:ADP-ribose pyrophosphatase YjhB (NUDIX family)